MFRRLREKIKRWWDVWFFVIAFPLALIGVLFLWYLLSQQFTNPWVTTGFAILFLYTALIVGISAIIAISETNKFTAAFILLFIGVVAAILGYVYTNNGVHFSLDRIANDFYANVSTELISVVITVLAIESLRERISWRNYQREKHRADEEPEVEPENGPIIEENVRVAPAGHGCVPLLLVGAACSLVGILIGLLMRRK